MGKDGLPTYGGIQVIVGTKMLPFIYLINYRLQL